METTTMKINGGISKISFPKLKRAQDTTSACQFGENFYY